MTTPTTEDLLQELESSANFLRGMTMDPSIPSYAKDALRARAARIDAITEAAQAEDSDDFLADSKACDLSGDSTCEACQ